MYKLYKIIVYKKKRKDIVIINTDTKIFFSAWLQLIIKQNKSL